MPSRNRGRQNHPDAKWRPKLRQKESTQHDDSEAELERQRPSRSHPQALAGRPASLRSDPAAEDRATSAADVLGLLAS